MNQIVVKQQNNSEVTFKVGDIAPYSRTFTGVFSFGEIVKINTVTLDICDWSSQFFPGKNVYRVKIADFAKMVKYFDQERDTTKTYNAPYLITPEGVDIVIAAQQQIIDNPVRAMVNSESSFVRQLISQVDENLARDYWSWVCGACSQWTKKNFSDSRILQNQEKLKAVDKAMPEMPAWGWSGT